MKILKIVLAFFAISTFGAYAQEFADGMRYQAVAFDHEGAVIVEQQISARFSILRGSERTLLYREVHDVRTDDLGLFYVVIGHGTEPEGEYSGPDQIDWGVDSLFLAVEITMPGSSAFRLMGEQQMMSVPFAMHAAGAGSYTVRSATGHDPGEAIFQVMNSAGETVFSVYESAVNISVDNPSKGVRGGFAVGGFSRSKDGGLNEYLRVDPGFVRITIDDDPFKGVRGGFAVGGFSTRKTPVPDFFRLSPGSASFMLDSDPGKGTRGGFAVGGFTSFKGSLVNEYLYIGSDSVRIYIDDFEDGDKGVRGGFAVGGFARSKVGDSPEFLRVDPGYVRIGIDDDPLKGTRGGFAVGGFTRSKLPVPEYFFIDAGLAQFALDMDYTKGTRAGFAVGGYTSRKGDDYLDYLYLTADSTRITIGDTENDLRGGFAVGLSDRNRSGNVDDILYVTPGSSQVYIINDSRKLLDGFSVFGLDEELRYTDLFTATREAITVTRTFEVVPTVRTGEVTGITTESAIGGGVVLDDDDQGIIRRGLVWRQGRRPRLDTAFDGMTEEIMQEGDRGLGELSPGVTGMTGLMTGMQYFVRAWAENLTGIGYGSPVIFWTDNIITSEAGPNGTIDPEDIHVFKRGESRSYTITPDESYVISNVAVGGISVVDQVVIDPTTGIGTYDFVNDVTGPQTILADFARAVMRIHDVELQPGEIFTVNLEILNTGEIYGFNLDIVIPEGFEFIEDSEELFRSEGHFLEVDTPQDNIVRIISGSVEQKPYTGTDGTIVSFELRSSQTSGTYSLVIQDAVIGNRNAVNIATGTIDGTVTIE